VIFRAELIRDHQDERCSLGQIFLYDEIDAVVARFETLENPWLDNRHNVSCIPAKTYRCRVVVSPTYGLTFEIADVEGRTHILFHWGNYPSNTDGCVLLGMSRAEDVPAVWRSREAHTEFMKILEGVDEFQLTIIEEVA
jgi:hypothetical protein